MTKIIYKLDKKNSFEYIIIKDHANYAEQGRDIVCAAISAIANGTINFLQRLERKRKTNIYKNYSASNNLADMNQSLNEEQKKVYELIIKQKANVFFTGAAGTGKSFLLQKIVSALEVMHGRKSIGITATTGIAAVNISGVTLHSFGGIGYADELTTEELITKIQKQKSKKWTNN
ncbi:11661_t:CDS:2 [Entrophospora sp. SA101]|nr:11661_t:CDS:2 [Entrophospora sp. SA101]